MDEAGLHLPPEVRDRLGRYPCGEETRQRIIATAVAIFGRQGFAGTSTRDIAQAAGIKTPAIQYYFGSKLGLYDACIDQLSATVARRIAPELDSCRVTVAARAPLDQIVTALCRAQDCLIDACFDNYEGHAIQRLMAWEDVENRMDTSDTLMKDRIARPIFDTFRAVVVGVTPPPGQPDQADIQTLALMGISMIFHVNHTRLRDLLSQATLDNGFLANLKQVAHQQLHFALYGLAAAPLPSGPRPAD